MKEKVLGAVLSVVMAVGLVWVWLCILGVIAVADGQPECGCVRILEVTVYAVVGAIEFIRSIAL